ncbi:sugar transferase [Dyadobacter sp. CY327]|uniref:sugar transferase n=1 Tax=Dyadobacter sp. CY327 TaxID=2907301 RepID=UPI001F2A426A|nr:sugar transferase [Dyadobacter sp. CY327]MCE7071033.1 sugar transferase [Dyadobacter sp. CY327]
MFNKREHLAFTAFEIFLAFELAANILLMIVSQYWQKLVYRRKRYAVMLNGSPTRAFDDFHEDRRRRGFQLCGVFNLAETSTQYQQLHKFIQQEQPDYLYCWLSGIQPELLQNIIDFSETQKTHVRLIPDNMNFLDPDFQVEYTEKSPFMFINTCYASDTHSLLIKRSFDVVFSLMVLVIGFPLFLFICALVIMAFRKSVFSMEQRVGRSGRTFRIIKFRTTENDGSDEAHWMNSQTHYLNAVGYFLRRSRLEEMPQFINVLKGDMSIVGPRPLLMQEAEMLIKESNDDLRKILSVRPGITSIGQIEDEYMRSVNGKMGQIKQDMCYLDSYSLTKDLQLILLTIQLLLVGKGR